MLNAKVLVSKIAVEIGRHRPIVIQELKRNRSSDKALSKLNGDYGMTEQCSAAHRRTCSATKTAVQRIRWVDHSVT